MKRTQAIIYGESWLEDEYLDAEDRAFIEEALQALKQEPCDNCKYLDGDGCRLVFEQIEYGKASDECPSDNNVSTKNTVSRGVLEQVMWERDVAISQLKKLGYELGQKVEPCEDEYIKVPKKALKYRTAGMVAYNAEWLKNHFDIERIAICGAQQPCEDTISRQAVIDVVFESRKNFNNEFDQGFFADKIKALPPVNPQPCEDAISRQAVLDLAKKGILVSNGNYKSVCKAINELPSANLMPCEDAISRDAVWNVMQELWGTSGELLDSLMALPSVKPQEPKTIQEKQAESEKYEKAFDDGYKNGYAQARFDYEQEPKSTEEATKEFKELLESGYYEPQKSNDKCKNCEYYRNPDYTRCYECKLESEVQ